MTLFEYLVIAFALLYASAAMRLIGGLPEALDRSRRYWLHVMLVLLTLLIIAFNFWNFWSLNAVDWTLPKFLFALLVPSLLYFCASILIPENPERIESWEQHYFSVRVRYFSGLALWLVVLSGVAYIFLELPLIHPARVGHAVGFSLAIVGIGVANERAQAVVVVLLLAMLVALAITVGTEPAWLTATPT